jgi:hypothetical protein
MVRTAKERSLSSPSRRGSQAMESMAGRWSHSMVACYITAATTTTTYSDNDFMRGLVHSERAFRKQSGWSVYRSILEFTDSKHSASPTYVNDVLVRSVLVLE